MNRTMQQTSPLDRIIERLARSRNLHERNALCVGRDCFHDIPAFLDVDLLFEHAHLLGATGSGKTSLGLIPMTIQLIRRNDGAVVIIDGKGDMALFNTVREEAERLGRPFKWFSNQTHHSTYVFNPLEPKILRTMTPFDIVAFVAQSLNLAHGDDYGRAWFSAAIRDLARRSLTFSTKGAYNALRSSVQAPYPRLPFGSFVEMAQILEEMGRLEPDEVKAARHFCLLIDELAEMPQVNLSPVHHASPEVMANAIQMSEVVREKQVVYFHLTAGINPVSAAEVGRLAIFSLLLAAMDFQRQNGVASRNYCICDEAQTIIAQNIAQVLAQARSAGVGLVLCHQSMNQLKPPGGIDLRELVMNCTAVKQYFTARDPWLQEYIAQMSGQTKYLRATYRQSHSNFVAGRLGVEYAGGGLLLDSEVSMSEALGPRLMPHDIQNYSRQQNTCLFCVEQQKGLSQFHGFFPVHIDWPMSKAEYDRRLNSVSWPPATPGTIVVVPQWPPEPSAAVTPPTLPSATSATEDLKRIRDKLKKKQS